MGIEEGYTKTVPAKHSLTVGKFTQEISTRNVVILHLSDIFRELACLFLHPSPPDSFSTCLTVTKINNFQWYFRSMSLAKVHFLL